MAAGDGAAKVPKRRVKKEMVGEDWKETERRGRFLFL
jgi:hypothetical protein